VPGATPTAAAGPGTVTNAPGDQGDGPRALWRTIASRIRTHRWSAIAASATLLALAGLGVRWWLGASVVAEVVLRRDFLQAVVASGRVETPHRVSIGAQMIGTVVRVPVAEGQVVKAGDLLVELESGELTAIDRQAGAAVEQAAARLRQLQEVQAPVAAQTSRQARTSLDNALASLARSQSLYAKGLIPRADLDDASRTAELADAQMRLTLRQVETTGPSGSDRALALADVAGARANAQAVHARSAYALVTAPVSGTLITRSVEVGDVVQPGTVLMTLSPEGRTQLVVQIDEKNLQLLALDQAALVSADAFPAQRFDARLAYINPSVNAQTGAVEIKLDVPSAPVGLRQDMTVSVDIEVARRPNAVLVPAGAIHDAVGSAPWVLRVEGRRAVRVPVRLGLRSGGFAEVLEGLHEGDRVIPATASIEAGARVRLASPSPPSPS
jgi:HlyD family secretion protein